MAYSTSTSKLKKPNLNDEIPKTKHTFISPYRQQFSIPENVIYYSIKKVSNCEVYQKLIQTCKYFFANIILPNEIDTRETGYWINHTEIKNKTRELPNGLTANKKIKIVYTMNVENLRHKIWVTNQRRFDTYFLPSSDCLSKFLNKTYAVDCAKIILGSKQIITFENYLKLTWTKNNIEFLMLDGLILKNDTDNSEVELSELLKQIPYIKSLYITVSTNFTQETVQRLLELPKFEKLENLYFREVPESFDMKTFGEFIKRHKGTKFVIYFKQNLTSNEIKNFTTIFKQFRLDETFKGCTLKIKLGHHSLKLK